MREIKFRAWLKDSALDGLNKSHFTRNGRLYEVEWMNFEGGLVSVRTPSELEFKFNDVEIMQRTGLLDKKGKEIYEGDIVKFNHFKPSVCVWSGWGWGWESQTPKGKRVYESGVSQFKQDEFDESYTLNNAEVLGNIYENPELLGGAS